MFAGHPFAAAPFAALNAGPVYVSAGGDAPGVAIAAAPAQAIQLSAAKPKGGASAFGWGQRIIEGRGHAPGLSYSRLAANAWRMAQGYAQAYASAVVRTQSYAYTAGSAPGVAAMLVFGQPIYWVVGSAAGVCSVLGRASALRATYATARGVSYALTSAGAIRTAASRADGKGVVVMVGGRVISFAVNAAGVAHAMGVGVDSEAEHADTWARGISTVLLYANYVQHSRSTAAGAAAAGGVGQSLFDSFAEMGGAAWVNAHALSYAMAMTQAHGRAVVTAPSWSKWVRAAVGAAEGQATAKVRAMAYAITKGIAQGKAKADAPTHFRMRAYSAGAAFGVAFATAAGQSTRDAVGRGIGVAGLLAHGLRLLSAGSFARGVSSVHAIPGNSINRFMPPALNAAVRPYEAREASRPFESRQASRGSEERKAVR